MKTCSECRHFIAYTPQRGICNLNPEPVWKFDCCLKCGQFLQRGTIIGRNYTTLLEFVKRFQQGHGQSYKKDQPGH